MKAVQDPVQPTYAGGRSTDDRHAAWMQETADGIGGLHGVLHGFHVFDFCRKAAIDAWCSAVV